MIRNIEAEKNALSQITTDKNFLNQIGIKAGTDLGSLKATNPTAYNMLFNEVNRRAYATDPNQNNQQDPTLTKALEVNKGINEAVDNQYPAKTSEDYINKLSTLRDTTGLNTAQKEYTTAQNEYLQAPVTVKEDLTKNKGYDIQGATNKYNQMATELATARSRYLDGSLSGEAYMSLISNAHNAAKELKNLNTALEKETTKGVNFYATKVNNSKANLDSAKAVYDASVEAEKMGLTDSKKQRETAAKNLMDAYTTLKKDAQAAEKEKKTELNNYYKTQGKVVNPITGAVESIKKSTKGGSSTSVEGGYTKLELRKLREAGLDKASIEEKDNYLYGSPVEKIVGKLTPDQKLVVDALDQSRGADTFNSPQDVADMRDEFLKAGGTLDTFEKILKENKHLNPNNKDYYNVKKPATSSKKRKPLF